jgi:hypothetical protein
MAVGSTQTLTEMSNRNLPGDKGRPACKAGNHTAICEPTVWRKCGSLEVSQPHGASTACCRDSFTSCTCSAGLAVFVICGLPINRERIIRVADYPGACLAYRLMCLVSENKLHMKWPFKRERVQNEGRFISRLNMNLETGEGFLYFVFLFNK